MVIKIKNPTKLAALGFMSIPLFLMMSGGYMTHGNDFIGFSLGVIGILNYLFVVYGYENKEENKNENR